PPAAPFQFKGAMRESEQHPTRVRTREIELNPPITVYDPSGPYTDEHAEIDVRKGLSRIRERWILDRGDVQVLDSVSSEYGRARLADQSLDELRFEYRHKPKVAKEGCNVTQLHYARKGIIKIGRAHV